MNILATLTLILRNKFMRAIGLALLFVAVIYAVFVHPLSPNSEHDIPKLIGRSDHWQFYVPYAYFLDSTIQQGEIPLWNQLILCGNPFAANPQSFLFYPPNMLRTLLTVNPTPLKTHVGLAIMLAAHLVMACLGTYKFTRSYHISRCGSLVAAFVFVFSAAMVRRAYSNMLVSTLAWLPIALFFLKKALESKSRHTILANSLLTGAVFGLSILTGSPHMSFLMGIAIAIFSGLHYLTNINCINWRLKDSTRKIIKYGTTNLFALAIGGLIASAMLIPATEFAAHSERGYQSNQQPIRKHTIESILTMAVMYGGGDTGTHGNYRLTALGGLILVLAAIGHRQKRNVFLFFSFFLIFMDFALGPPLPFSRTYILLAPFRLSETTRATLFACFPLGVLAGFGFDAIFVKHSNGIRYRVYIISLLAVGSGLLGYLIYSLDHHPFLRITNLVAVPPALVLMTIIGLALTHSAGGRNRDSASITTKKVQSPLFSATRLVLLILVLTEIVIWNRHYIPFLATYRKYPSLEVLKTNHAPWQNNRRGAEPRPNISMLSLRPTINGYDTLYINRAHNILLGKNRYVTEISPSDVLSKSIFGHLLLKRQFWLAKQYTAGPLPKSQSEFPVTTTAFVESASQRLQTPSVSLSSLADRRSSQAVVQIPLVTKQQLERLTKRERDGSLTVTLPAIKHPGIHSAILIQYKSDLTTIIRPSFYAFSEHSKIPGFTSLAPPTGKQDGLLSIPLPDIERFNLILKIDSSHPQNKFQLVALHLLADQADEGHLIEVKERRANSVFVSVGPLSGYRILTFVDANYPGWRAFIGGKEVEIFTTNGAFKGIEIPPGKHEVEFKFKPIIVYFSASLSLLSVISVIAGLMFINRSPLNNKGISIRRQDST